jgi:hypothetical protein
MSKYGNLGPLMVIRVLASTEPRPDCLPFTRSPYLAIVQFTGHVLCNLVFSCHDVYVKLSTMETHHSDFHFYKPHRTGPYCSVSPLTPVPLYSLHHVGTQPNFDNDSSPSSG